jgi:hypothetical protein
MGGFFGPTGQGKSSSGPSTAPVVLETASSAFPSGFVLTAGANITLTPAAGSLTVAATGGGASTANVTPDTHPASPTAWDDEFESGTSIDLTGARRAGANPWVPENVLTTTNSVANGALILTGANSGINDDTVWLQPLTGTGAAWTFTTKRLIPDPTDSFAGLFVGFAATGKGYYFGYFDGSTFIESQNTFAGAGAGTVTSTMTFTSATLPQYLSIQLSGSNLVFKVSLDGINYFTVLTASLASFLGSAPDSIGLMIGSTGLSGGLSCSTSFDWFRKTA